MPRSSLFNTNSGRKQQSEAQMNSKTVVELNKLPFTKTRKRFAGPFRKGLPDITGVSNGYAIELEGKLPGNKPTDLQKKRLREYSACGAITGVYFSVEEAVQIIVAELKLRGIEVDYPES